MKKRCLGLFLFALFGATSLFAAAQPVTKKVRLTPLFPPGVRVHQHYIE